MFLSKSLSFFLIFQKGRGRDGRVAKSGKRGVALWGKSNTSPPPPLLSPLPAMPSIPQVYQARLQTERAVKHRSHSSEEARSGAEAPDELPSSQVMQLLLQTEVLLMERRERQRLANRMWLQDMVGRLDQLVLIPP